MKPALALPSARVLPFDVTRETRRKDFERANIKLVDDAGEVADLHRLRTTLGTRLALAGIAPQIAQRITRHSDYKLHKSWLAQVADAESDLQRKIVEKRELADA